MIIQEINIKPTLNECFADNGAHSHWELIDSNNGRILWSESQASDKDKEIERLKELIEEIFFKLCGDRFFKWQQFKTENNL